MLYEIINKIQRIQNQILDYIIIVSTKNSYNFGSTKVQSKLQIPRDSNIKTTKRIVLERNILLSRKGGRRSKHQFLARDCAPS